MTILHYIIPRFIRKFVKRVALEMQILKWRINSSSKADLRSLTAHLLVVRDPRYCFFARICVFSFLHFHPNSHVVIHSDEFTRNKLIRLFRREIAASIVRVVSLEGEWDSWQEMKVSVVSQLKISKEFFVDADMRFRGVIPELKKPTMFVREYNLSEVFPFALIKEFWKKNGFGHNAWMCNSSFVWLGFSAEEISNRLELGIFRNFQSSLKVVLDRSQIGSEATNQIWRLREQIFLSLVLGSFELGIDTLKTSDARLDGQFLESAYFGSTGLGF